MLLCAETAIAATQASNHTQIGVFPMTRTTIVMAAGLAVAVMLPAASAQAQAPRTFVSAAGSDSNPCSFAAPCRHFQAAVNATSLGGEVDALDPALAFDGDGLGGGDRTIAAPGDETAHAIVDRVTRMVAPVKSASNPLLALLAIVELRTMTLSIVPPPEKASMPDPALFALTLSLTAILTVWVTAPTNILLPNCFRPQRVRFDPGSS